MELRQLRALLAVVEAGTFTDAAIGLGVSQASVSRAVAALETHLGVRLLHRTTRVVTTTAPGARVVVHARRVLAELEALERAAGESDGVLRLGYQWAALGRHTVTVQRRWTAAHPGTRLDLVQVDSATAGLLEGLTDAAVTRRGPDDARFGTSLIGSEARFAAVSADDPWARRRFVRMRDFAGRTVAVSPTSTTTGRLWEDLAPVTLRSVGGMDEWLIAIAAGDVVGMTAEATVALHPRPGVVYRPVRDAEPVLVHLVWWRNDPPPGLTGFLALAREAYAGG